MHTKPMKESDGTATVWKPVVVAGWVCPKCKGAIEYRDWESSCGGYEDQQFRCTSCKHSWWVEGPDA